MGLDITFYKRSKLDPRYKEEVGYFRKVNCILTYFGIGENDNCEYVVIPKEKFEQFRDDLKKNSVHIKVFIFLQNGMILHV